MYLYYVEREEEKKDEEIKFENEELDKLFQKIIQKDQTILPEVRKHYDHVIKLIDENNVTSKPSYRIPEAHKEEVNRQIAELLKKGFIEESDSPFAAPVIAIKKQDNSIRLCCD